MKKIIALLLALLMLTTAISLSGCEFFDEFDIKHEHSWDNWRFEQNDSGLTLICTLCDEVIKKLPTSEGLDIQDGVLLGIGSCTDRRIVVPHGVVVIGEEAFKNNSEIEGIYLPETVKVLGASSFENCTSLTVVNIPEGVIDICNSVFKGCTSLTGVLLPETLSYLGRDSFGDCPTLVTVYYKGDEIAWYNVDVSSDWLNGSPNAINQNKNYGKDCEHQWEKPQCIIPTNCYTPEVWHSICTKCKKVSRIVKSKGCHPEDTEEWIVPLEATCLTSGYRYKRCACGLSGVGEYIDLEHTVVYSLNENTVGAFCQTCNAEVISCDYIEGSAGLDIREGVVWGIGECGDKDIVIPSYYDGYAVTEIRDYAFVNTDITSVTVPDSVLFIGYYAFGNCTSLKTVNIGKNLIGIEGAFSGCTGLESIKIESENLQMIGNRCFDDCYSLKQLDIPDSISYMHEHLFDDLPSDFEYNEYGGGKYIGNSSNPYAVLVEINPETKILEIPEQTKVIYSRMYNTSSDIYIGSYLKEIKVDPNNKYFTSIDGNLYSKDGKTLIRYANGKEDTSFTIPEGVTNVGIDAFDSSFFLQEVVISEGVKVLEMGAFSNCSHLTSVTLPSSLEIIHGKAFQNCRMTNMVIPEGVKYIGTGAFHSTSLVSITLPKSLEFIGYSIFRGCYTIETIEYNGNQRQWHQILKPNAWDYSKNEIEEKDCSYRIFYTDSKTQPEHGH